MENNYQSPAAFVDEVRKDQARARRDTMPYSVYQCTKDRDAGLERRVARFKAIGYRAGSAYKVGYQEGWIDAMRAIELALGIKFNQE